MKIQIVIKMFRMIPIFLMLFSSWTINSFGQVIFEVPVNDTVVDFSSSSSSLSGHGQGDRVVKSDDNTLYVEYLFTKSENTMAEYFRITDMEYHYIDYYVNGEIKSKGQFKATDTITHMDIVSTSYPYPPYDVYDFAICYRSLYKTGEWLEYSKYIQKLPYLDYWIGEYCKGHKCGVWKHQTAVLASFELERIDYDTDSNKIIYLRNRVSESLDTLETLLIGSWRDLSCSKSDSSRIELRKCMPIKGTNRLQCWDGNSNPDYYHFSKNGGMEMHTTKNCIIFGGSTEVSKWNFFQKGNAKYVEFKASDRTWKFKILYMDKDSILLERDNT